MRCARLAAALSAAVEVYVTYIHYVERLYEGAEWMSVAPPLNRDGTSSHSLPAF